MNKVMSIFVGAICNRPLWMLNARELQVCGCEGAAE